MMNAVLPNHVASYRRLATALATALGLVACDDTPGSPVLPPALQAPVAPLASAETVDALDLVEGPDHALGLRLPVGARPLPGSNGTTVDVFVTLDRLERFLVARAKPERISRHLGGGLTMENVTLTAPVPESATGLALYIVVKPIVGGYRMFVSEWAVGLPARSADPNEREAEAARADAEHRQKMAAAGLPELNGAVGPGMGANVPTIPVDRLPPLPTAFPSGFAPPAGVDLNRTVPELRAVPPPTAPPPPTPR